MPATLKVRPLEWQACLQLFSFISFVATDAEVDIVGREWQHDGQELSIHLRGSGRGLSKVSYLVQQDYPKLSVHLEVAELTARS